MNFASDNTSGVHPKIMQALVAANEGNLPSYGSDHLTQAATDQLRDLFEAPDACVYFVPTGCASNALALSLLAPGWGRVFCHESAHIQSSESGAPEFYTDGAKLVTVAGEGGLIDEGALRAGLMDYGRSSVHSGKNSALSLTNATEWGRVYSVDHVAGLSAIAREAGMAVHLDGARFVNALAAQNQSPAQMTWRSGVDVLCLGGTKNGCMGVEAVMIFDPSRAEEFEYRRKRGGHLLSKHRFLAAQVLAWLEGGLWLDLARHSNAVAHRLGQGLSQIEGVRLDQPVETNGVFATLPRAIYERARAVGAQFHQWPGDQFDDGQGPVGVRLVCGWDTSETEVDGFLAALLRD